MSSTPDLEARLARLHVLNKSDLAALPDRILPPPQDTEIASVSDDDTPGGVPLVADTSGKQAVPASSPASGTVQSASAPEELALTATPNTNEERRFVWKEGAPSSLSPAPMPMPKPLTLPRPVQLPPTTLARSELANQKSYAPIVALSRYPYKFCNKDDSQAIASAFFDAGKFWDREWDLYYVWDIEESRPLILVSESQFNNLLQEINRALDLSVRITNRQRADNLVGRFPDHPRCQPRYLGRSTSRDEYNSLVDSVPSAMSRPAEEPMPPSLDDSTLKVFKEQMEEMFEHNKAKQKTKGENRKLQQLKLNKAFAEQFKRAQRYLGLRQTTDPNAMPSAPAAVDVSIPAPFAFDRSVVFICADVESHEKAHSKITEVGIATLDTRELSGVAPGKDGENWRPLIRARHFRIREYSHLVNSEYIAGCPDRFDFGTSEWVKLSDATAKIAECFKEPFGGSKPTDMVVGSEERNLVFLGHDAMTDVRYLDMLGFDLLSLPNMLETQDTAAMYRVWRRDQQPTNLGRILYDFDIAGFNLHNAGNDAVFTVQAMLAICVREASIRATPELKALRDENKAAKLAAALEEAKQRAEDEAAVWNDDDDDDEGDGGAPVKAGLPPKKSKQKEPKNAGFIGSHRVLAGPSQRDNNQGEVTPGRGQGRSRGRGRGRGRGRVDGPNSSHRPNNGGEEAGQQVCSDLMDLN